MGDFGGHILPGSIFIMFGIWWTTQIAKYRAQKANNKRVPNFTRTIRTFFPSFCCGRTIPLESILRVTFAFIGICAELTSAALQTSSFSMAVIYFQHISMYTMFLLSGVSELLVNYKILVPKGTDYFTVALAFILEAILFISHVEHQGSYEKQVHVLLIFTIVLGCMAIVIEAWMPERLDFKYIRAFFVILQGTWFWQIGFLFYNPIPGQPKVWHSTMPHQDNMWLSVIFAWHCIFILLFQLAITYLTWYLHHGCSLSLSNQYSVINKVSEMPLIDEKETSNICIEEDSEECQFPGND